MNLYFFDVMYLECGPCLAVDENNAKIKKEDFRLYDVESAEPFLDERGRLATYIKCKKSDNPIPNEQNVFSTGSVLETLKEVNLQGKIKYFDIDKEKVITVVNDEYKAIYIDTIKDGFCVGVTQK